MLSNKEEALMLRAPRPGAKESKYKTELCTKFLAQGSCPYGSKCQFAHGEHELRNRERHDRYKTRICKRFVEEGFCPYKHRCVFVHPGEQAACVPQQARAVDGKSIPVVCEVCPEAPPSPAKTAAAATAVAAPRRRRTAKAPAAAPRMQTLCETAPCVAREASIDCRNDETFGPGADSVGLDLAELAGRALHLADARPPAPRGGGIAAASPTPSLVPTLHSRGRSNTSFSQLMREADVEREEGLAMDAGTPLRAGRGDLAHVMAEEPHMSPFNAFPSSLPRFQSCM